ncbi:beta-phosphoglucomutase [Photobacterium sagamiensis]|uniref:beta-phosphoglucomutase n=1 Tax=Photobacterium sagamiensis TaxID=2910241 RepID=UPI003D0D145F
MAAGYLLPGVIMKNVNVDIKGVIFDLDGVLVDTAKFHYIAWKKIADDLQLDFNIEDNEKLKGVSRKKSLEIILDLNHKVISEEDKGKLLESKNNYYLELIKTLDESDVLPGVKNLISQIQAQGIRIALGSASKNAKVILTSTGIIHHFDQLVDGNMVSKAKPDPEVFITAAKLLNLEPQNCVVFEDAEAGVEAALAAEMRVIGVGDKVVLCKATRVAADLCDFNINSL